MFHSILTPNNQLALLYDLLDEQQSYSNELISEYKHLKQLVKTMTKNQLLMDENFQMILHEIYYYSIKGERVHSYKDHIKSNEDNIKKWLKTIEKKKRKIP